MAVSYHGLPHVSFIKSDWLKRSCDKGIFRNNYTKLSNNTTKSETTLEAKWSKNNIGIVKLQEYTV